MNHRRALPWLSQPFAIVAIVLFGVGIGFFSAVVLLPDQASGRSSNVHVRPIHQLKLKGSREGLDVWSSTGRDPQFLLKPIENGYFRAGRYEMRLMSLEKPAVFGHAALYFDSFNSFSEREKLHLKFSRKAGDKYLVATFELPTTAYRLRFDPVIQPTEFTLGPILVDQLVMYPGAL